MKVESAEEKSEKSVGVGVLGWLGTGSNCSEGMMILQSPSRSGVWQIWYAEKNASVFFKVCLFFLTIVGLPCLPFTPNTGRQTFLTL